MPLDPSKTQFTANFLSKQYYFDSEYCMSSFIEGAKIAYFSMEIGINSAMPTYSGGLGVLAGDVIRSSADLRIPLVAVTLVSKKGYLKQKITADGWQMEYPEEWDPSKFMKLLPETATRQNCWARCQNWRLGLRARESNGRNHSCAVSYNRC